VPKLALEKRRLFIANSSQAHRQARSVQYIDHCAYQGVGHPDRSADRRIFIFYACHFAAGVWRGEGQDWEAQKKALTRGAEVIVATPGKLISHLNLGYVKFEHLQHLILDEADRMLDMGFHDDIQKIITYLPKERQTLMFSATMPPKIRELAKKVLQDPVEINIALSKPAAGVVQAVCMVYDSQKRR
jgi:superfamily II DNA/RNA helicase